MNEKLSKLDVELSKLYKSVIGKNNDPVLIKSEQLDWINKMQKQDSVIDMEKMYKIRIKELEKY
jgi:uncharacterized protein